MKRFALIGGIILAAVALFFVMVQMKPEPPRKERVDLDPLVEVLELETMSANFRVTSQGTVRPRTQTVLSAEISGTITSISPKLIAGGVFAANEVLLRIDPTNYEVAVDQAQALVRQRQIEYDGAVKLRSQGYRAEAELASAAAALATARAELVRAKRNLERTSIRLPYAGMVRSKDADLGQFVNPGTMLGVVFATDYAEVRLPLTDLDLAFVDLPGATDIASSGGVENGPPVTLTATQKGLRKSWDARIVRTEGVVDESSRVTYAVARIKDPYALGGGDALPIGTFVSAAIAGSEAENIIRVPRSVVRGSDELIFVDVDDKIRTRRVSIVRGDADYVYINGGAVPGERVVVTALETPVNGMPVRVRGDGVDETDDGTGRLASSAEAD